MTILTDWHLSINTDDILRGQGMDPETIRLRRPSFITAAQQALDIGSSLLHPAAVTHTLAVLELRHERILLENGAQLSGPLVARHLSGAQNVAAVICTIGPELENNVASLLNENSLLAMALDGLGNSAVEMLAQQVCEYIGKQAQAEGLTTSTPLSPGSPDWPVEIGQPQIFALVEAGQIGVQVTSGGMMIPKKSVTFVTGIGPAMAQTDLCEVCSLRETCRYRHA